MILDGLSMGISVHACYVEPISSFCPNITVEHVEMSYVKIVPHIMLMCQRCMKKVDQGYVSIAIMSY